MIEDMPKPRLPYLYWEKTRHDEKVWYVRRERRIGDFPVIVHLAEPDQTPAAKDEKNYPLKLPRAGERQ